MGTVKWSAFLLAMAIVLTACSGTPDNPARRAEAMGVADAFLRAVSGGQLDRGWSLLHPYSQEDWGNEAAWVEAAGKADWSRFAFTELRTRYCDDGVICPVDLEIPGGPGSVPDLISSADAGVTFGLDERPERMRAEIWIWLPDLLRGPGGIMVPKP
jgi:hypothetical protein